MARAIEDAGWTGGCPGKVKRASRSSTAHSRSAVPAIAGGTPVRSKPLPFFRAAVDESDVTAVAETLRSGWLTSGPKAVELEKRLGEYLGTTHTIAVSRAAKRCSCA